ncbi:hypothetical protein D3C72_2375420 [compost metagenome]
MPPVEAIDDEAVEHQADERAQDDGEENTVLGGGTKQANEGPDDGRGHEGQEEQQGEKTVLDQ